jgi:hypothetical protein
VGVGERGPVHVPGDRLTVEVAVDQAQELGHGLNVLLVAVEDLNADPDSVAHAFTLCRFRGW